VLRGLLSLSRDIHYSRVRHTGYIHYKIRAVVEKLQLKGHYYNYSEASIFISEDGQVKISIDIGRGSPREPVLLGSNSKEEDNAEISKLRRLW
jgi:hypothetical protein